MTSENETAKGGAGAHVPGRRRMAGYTPLPQQDTAQGPTRDAGASAAAVAGVSGSPQVSGSPGVQSAPTAPAAASAHARPADTRLEPTAAPAAPVRETWMSGAPQPLVATNSSTFAPGTALDTATGPPKQPSDVDAASAGAAAPSSAPARKTRMGGAAATYTAATVPDEQTAPATPRTVGTRMGVVTPAAASPASTASPAAPERLFVIEGVGSGTVGPLVSLPG